MHWCKKLEQDKLPDGCIGGPGGRGGPGGIGPGGKGPLQSIGGLPPSIAKTKQNKKLKTRGSSWVKD